MVINDDDSIPGRMLIRRAGNTHTVSPTAVNIPTAIKVISTIVMVIDKQPSASRIRVDFRRDFPRMLLLQGVSSPVSASLLGW